MKSPFPEGYIGSTKCELDHRMGNNLGIVRLVAKQVPQPANFAELAASNKTDFIAGLSRAVEEAFPVFGGVTHHNLTEVVNLANQLDWTDLTQLQQLIDKCGELRKPLE